MAEKRKNWNGLISGFSASDLVFLDESGCNTDMTRRYGNESFQTFTLESFEGVQYYSLNSTEEI